jgi:hypothetical protein
MRALTLLAESVARRPAGPAHPDVNGGVSFVALRDAAPLPAGQSTRRLLTERLQELSAGAAALDQIDPRLSHAAGILQSLSQRADEALAGPSSPQPAVLEHV